MPSKAPIHRPVNAKAQTLRYPEANRQARRTMPTNSARWLALRREILIRDNYTCQCCGRVVGGKGEAHVDHRDGNNRNRDKANLQALCRRCHSSKTARENGAFGNRRAASVANC